MSVEWSTNDYDRPYNYIENSQGGWGNEYYFKDGQWQAYDPVRGGWWTDTDRQQQAYNDAYEDARRGDWGTLSTLNPSSSLFGVAFGYDYNRDGRYDTVDVSARHGRYYLPETRFGQPDPGTIAALHLYYREVAYSDFASFHGLSPNAPGQQYGLGHEPISGIPKSLER